MDTNLRKKRCSIKLQCGWWFIPRDIGRAKQGILFPVVPDQGHRAQKWAPGGLKPVQKVGDFFIREAGYAAQLIHVGREAETELFEKFSQFVFRQFAG